MPATPTEDLLRRLRTGRIDPADAATLERLKAGELLAALAPVYPFRFQERRLSGKWEVGLARSLRHELAAHFVRDSQVPILLLVPVLHNCLMLSGEDDAITGIGTVARIMVRPIRKPFPGLALTSGRGFKFDKFPDGWVVKPRRKRTVKLTEAFLQQRGWRFDLFRQFATP